MKLVTFEINGRSAVGLLNADATAVHPVPGCADMQALIGLWPALDTAAVLRAAEIGADAILLAKNIDGVYSADPHVDPGAVKYDAITYDEVLAKHLAVMDLTATSLAMENDIPVVVFALADPQNIVRAVMGEPVGTVVTK